MILYAESSAVLAWLLGERQGQEVRDLLAGSETIVASDLTLIECDRVLIRAATLGDVSDTDAVALRMRLTGASAHWNVLHMNPEITDRARQPFPGEPIRTLDALHLASALAVRAVVPGLEILSLDHRLRASAMGLGFRTRPE